jgi:hypothetical protein
MFEQILGINRKQNYLYKLGFIVTKFGWKFEFPDSF